MPLVGECRSPACRPPARAPHARARARRSCRARRRGRRVPSRHGDRGDGRRRAARTARRTAAARRAPHRRSTTGRPRGSASGSRRRAGAALSSKAQSSTNPADGGSKATGAPAIAVQTSHSASGSAMCAYWIGRPCRAMPAQIASGVAVEAHRRPGADGPACAVTVAPQRAERQRDRRAQAAAGRRGARCGVRWSPSPKTMAVKLAHVVRRPATRRPARRSFDRLRRSRRCTPCRLAGRVAASLATTRSPGASRSAQAARGACREPAVGVDDQQAGVARPLDRRGRRPSCAPPARLQDAAAMRASDLARRIARPLQRGRIGVGHGERMQRRVHVARVDGDDRARRAAAAPRPRSGSGGSAPPCWRRTRPSRHRA